jgi:hypothetical protein
MSGVELRTTSAGRSGGLVCDERHRQGAHGETLLHQTKTQNLCVTRSFCVGDFSCWAHLGSERVVYAFSVQE